MKISTIRFPLTSAAIALAITVVSAALIWDINLVALPFRLLDRIEQHEIDDIVTAVILVIVAFLVDHAVAARRERREITMQAERLRVVKVTMRTVQDIVNNCLNQLQLVRFEAEGHVSQEALAIFDASIQETAAKLKTLGDLETYTEKQMEVGAGLGD
jgi:hypothetical protein